MHLCCWRPLLFVCLFYSTLYIFPIPLRCGIAMKGVDLSHRTINELCQTTVSRTQTDRRERARVRTKNESWNARAERELERRVRSDRDVRVVNRVLQWIDSSCDSNSLYRLQECIGDV